MRVWLPCGLRLPPLILRATTSGRVIVARIEIRQPHSHSTLAHHLPPQIELGLAPGVAIRTPVPLHLMLNDLHRWGRGHLNYLAAPSHVEATQSSLALRASLDPVCHHLRRLLTLPGMIVFGRALLADFCPAFRPIRFHEGRRRLLLDFQFGNPLVCTIQLPGERPNLLHRRVQLAGQVRYSPRHLRASLLIFLPLRICQCDHVLSLPAFSQWSSLNTYYPGAPCQIPSFMVP